MSEVLPKGWSITSINEIINKIGLFVDGDWIESKDQDPSGNIRLLQLADIGDGNFIDKSNRFINEETFFRLKCTQVLPGDVLVARMPYPLGRACLLPNIGYKAITVVDVCIIRPNKRYTNCSWLMYFINSNDFRNRIEGLASGTTRKRISRKNLSVIPLPLPPLNEQKRIVTKLDSIMPRIEAVKERLDKVPGILKRFRQSVLTAAVTGKLTEKWREDNPDVEISPHGIDYRDSEIAVTWKIVSFNNLISELRNGVSPKPNINPPGTKILRISANRSGYVNLEDYRFMPQGEEKYSQFLLNEGDLLFTRYNGNIDLVGVCGKVRHLKESYLYPDKLMRLRVYQEISDTDYLELVFQTATIRDYIISKSKTSAGQNGLSGKDLKLTPIPLPPLFEQKEIVRQVNKLFALADKVEDHYKKAKAKIDNLSQSVLAKAFRGELVPQDPNDEPAEKLLERIMEEKAKMESALKAVKKKIPQGNKKSK